MVGVTLRLCFSADSPTHLDEESFFSFFYQGEGEKIVLIDQEVEVFPVVILLPMIAVIS